MTTIATKYPFVGSIETRQGGRAENQDNAGYIDTPLGLLLVVCDGMGGGPGGRTASLMAVDTILSVLSDVSEHTPREDALKFAIDQANDIIYAKAKEEPELRGMGTTVAAILINESSAIIAHAGDTRIYQLRKGAIVFRSSDHSHVANLVRQKILTEEEARNHPQSNIITRALGIRPSMEIEFDEVSFLRGDRFVLCSDGIWGMMPQPDLVKSLSRVMGIGELTALVAEEVDQMGQAKGGGHDNLTIAVLDTSFDSNVKKNKEQCLAGNRDCPTQKCFRSPGTKRTIWIILAVIALSTVSLISYRILSRQAKSVDPIQDIGKPEKTGESGNIEPLVAENDEADTTNYEPKLSEVANRIRPEKAEQLFQDTTTIMIEQNKIILSRQIYNVVKDLDSLKTIAGKNAKEKKQEFINKIIRPEIDSLENVVAKGKKKDIREIIKMLNDKKSVSCSPKDSTHISLIKKKIKELQQSN